MSAQRQLSSLPRTQLDRLLGGEGLGIVIPPFVVRVRSPICVVADGIERLYSDHLLARRMGRGSLTSMWQWRQAVHGFGRCVFSRWTDASRSRRSRRAKRSHCSSGG